MNLPLSCDVSYHDQFLSASESAEIFAWICANCDVLDGDEITFADGTVHRINVGKYIFVDPELCDYSLLIKPHGRRMAWPPLIEPLRDRIEQLTGREFSTCVCLYYSSGEVGMDFHSDLPAYGPTDLIPSISLGAQRTIQLRKRSDPADQYELPLADGSLLLMGAGCQEDYEHAIPVDNTSPDPRINLTFRTFDWPSDYQRTKRVPQPGAAP